MGDFARSQFIKHHMPFFRVFNYLNGKYKDRDSGGTVGTGRLKKGFALMEIQSQQQKCLKVYQRISRKVIF